VKPALLSLMILLAAPPAGAQLIAIGQGEAFQVFIEPHSLRASGSSRIIWVITNRQAPDHDGDLSYRSLHEYDCARVKVRFLAEEYFRSNMAEGDRTGGRVGPSAWRDLGEETHGESVLKFVCSR
jgi:hypothetical protein